MRKSCISEYEFLKTQYWIVWELLKCRKNGMPPNRRISATEIAKGCRRMAGSKIINRSLVN